MKANLSKDPNIQEAQPVTFQAALKTLASTHCNASIFIGIPKTNQPEEPKTDQQPTELALLLSAADPRLLLDMLSTAALQIMTNAMEETEAAYPENPQAQEQIKETLYDHYNLSASKVLELFAPEFDLRPDLTAEAILKMENEILLSKEEQEEEAAALADIQKKIDETGDQGESK